MLENITTLTLSDYSLILFIFIGHRLIYNLFLCNMHVFLGLPLKGKDIVIMCIYGQ